MKTRKKECCIVFAALSVICSIVSIWSYLSSEPWGFARSVSPEERVRRIAVVQTAESYLGCRESDGSHAKIIDLYNNFQPRARGYEVTYSDSWCAAYVSAVAIACDMTEIIPTECSCQQQILLLQALNSWNERDSYLPLPGDIVYYDWEEPFEFDDCTGWSDHVGIIVGTIGPLIKVIEGNYDDCVSYRYILVNHPNIRGYGIPKYDI